jgi:gas vesicle protein
MDAEQDQLEQRVRYQRREMEGTLDEIGDRVNPRSVYDRQRRNMRAKVSGWRERLMGSPDYGSDGSSGDGRLSQAADAVSHAPDAIRQQTRGNPLAAGLVAFGAGLLAGSVMPETDVERRAVREAEPQMRRVAEEAKDVARDIGEDVKESAVHQAEELKETAKESAEHVKESAQESGQHVRDDAQQSTKRMQS